VRRTSMLVGALGVLLLVLAGLWLLIAPGRLVKYPSDLNKTAIATGTFTQYVDQATGVARAHPLVAPLSIYRNLRVVESTGSQAVVQERSVERIGTQPPQVLVQRYVISRTSLKDLRSRAAYAYVPANVVDRSPFYAINLPFGAGAGPYDIWKNEAGTAYAFRQAGSDFTRDGVTVRPMVGRLLDAPVAPYYAALLKARGLPAQLSATRFAAALKSAGFDVKAFAAAVLPRLSPADRAAIQPLLTQPVPLKYLVSVTTRLLIEPKTGGIVSLDRIDQTISATADVSGFTRLVTLLGRPRYANDTALKAVLGKLTTLTPPAPTRILNVRYGQTPASVADFAAYAKDKANGVDAVKSTIPLILALAGAMTLAAGIGLEARARRRRTPPAGPHEFPIATTKV
jgi:Porin PorA